MRSVDSDMPPVEVFFVVRRSGAIKGEREYVLRSGIYQALPQAEAELARLRGADSTGSYEVWKSSRYIELAEWLHRVVRRDGTLIRPRLRGVEKLSRS